MIEEENVVLPIFALVIYAFSLLGASIDLKDLFRLCVGFGRLSTLTDFTDKRFGFADFQFTEIKTGNGSPSQIAPMRLFGDRSYTDMNTP